MRAWIAAALGVALTAPAARAELLVARRPGVMCVSPDALARLSLPDGGSRTAVADPPPQLVAIARAGDCTDFPAGNVVILLTTRRNTSIVRSDTLTRDGVLATLIVPNIDYAPYSPPQDTLADAIRARCPDRLEEQIVLDMPTYGFVDSLPDPEKSQIERVFDDRCGPFGSCRSTERGQQVRERHLAQRFASFVCHAPR